MSLITRLLGFGLCLLGAFAIGYVQGIQSIGGALNNEVYRVLGTVPNFAPQVAPMIADYIQQNITPTLNPYLAGGIVLAVVGFLLVARGDRQPRSAKEKVPLQP